MENGARKDIRNKNGFYAKSGLGTKKEARYTDEEAEKMRVKKEELFQAIREGKEDLVEEIFKEWTPEAISWNDEGGNTCLHIACESEQRKIVIMCFHNEAEIDAQNVPSSTLTPFPMNSSLILFAFLVNTQETYFDLCFQNEGNTPLHYAFHKNNAKIGALLTTYGADDTLTNEYGFTPYEGLRPLSEDVKDDLINNRKIYSGSISALKALAGDSASQDGEPKISKISDELRSKYEKDPALPAMVVKFQDLGFSRDLARKALIENHNDEREAMEWLLKYGNKTEDVDSTKCAFIAESKRRVLNEGEQQMLFGYISDDISFKVEQLLAQGVSPDLKNAEGDTCLLAACKRKNERLIKACIREGADVNAQNVKLTLIHQVV